MSAPLSLPSAWRLETLGALIKPLYGKAIDKTQRRDVGQFPIVGSAGVMAFSDEPLVSDPVLVVGRKGNAGQVQRFNSGCWPIDTTYYFRLPDELDLDFAHWMLQAAELGKLDSSTTMPSLRREDLEAVQVVVPPLGEQHRIVETLEEHLSRLDVAASSLMVLKAKAELFRRCLLLAAFTGALSGHDAGGGHRPQGWSVRTLDEINDPKRPICYGILMPGVDFPGGVPYVKVRNIRGGRVLLEDLHHTTPEIDNKYPRSRLRTGDLLVSIRGTYGRTAVVPPELDGGNITQDSARVAPTGVNPSYVLRFLDSPYAQQFFKSVARGVAVKGVNIGDLRRLPVPLPRLEEQQTICDVLDEQIPRLDAMVEAANSAERKALALRRSLLHTAFTGELTKNWREKQNG